jgi:ribosomal protein S27AE
MDENYQADELYKVLSKEWSDKYITINTSCHNCGSECFIRIDGSFMKHVCSSCGPHTIMFDEIPDEYIKFKQFSEWIESMRVGYLKHHLRTM